MTHKEASKLKKGQEVWVIVENKFNDDRYKVQKGKFVQKAKRISGVDPGEIMYYVSGPSDWCWSFSNIFATEEEAKKEVLKRRIEGDKNNLEMTENRIKRDKKYLSYLKRKIAKRTKELENLSKI